MYWETAHLLIINLIKMGQYLYGNIRSGYPFLMQQTEAVFLG